MKKEKYNLILRGIEVRNSNKGKRRKYWTFIQNIVDMMRFASERKENMHMHFTDMKKFLKNLLQNGWSDVEDNFTELFLRWPFSKVDAKFQSLNKHGGYLYYTDMKQSSSLKPQVRFWIIFTEMFLGHWVTLLARLSTTCSQGAFRVVLSLSSIMHC